jgi:hypothetical protein
LFIRWIVFVFSVLGKFLLLPLWDRFSSCRQLQLAGRFRFDPDGPDEAQQFAPDRGDDLLLSLPAAVSFK